MAGFRLGADVGGTFTDVVLVGADGRVATRKVPSTPEDYGVAIREAVAGLIADLGLDSAEAAELVHGTTVATNAILEGRGPRTGLIATQGFRDTLEIGRLRYPRLYDLSWRKPTPLVPRRWRIEVPGRLGPGGEEVAPLDEDAVRRAIAFLLEEGVESLAVSLLHSYANAAHERRVGEIAREMAPDLPVSLSCDVLPEIGEYERTSTTAINAYLRPVVGSYLARLAEHMGCAGVRAPVVVMQSSGGAMSAAGAAEHPVHVIESGPAAGVIAAQALGIADAITLDMGGTTAKASIVEEGRLLRATEYEVGAGLNIGHRLSRGAGYVLRVPAIDVAEVGAGGGSLVWVDEAGALHVGPRSAGAVPGPVCYGAGGTEPTLTDANLLLGYLNPEALLGGALPVDCARAETAFEEKVARPLGLGVLEAAHGVHRVGVANMVRVVRAVSSERGRDPRKFALVAFGGNGPLHAAAVAEALGIARVIVPPSPGLFSAFGLLLAPRARHLSRTLLRPLDDLAPGELEGALDDLEARGRAELRAEGHTDVRVERFADLRYVGQSFELRVPVGGDLREAFEREHERTYGHRGAGDPVELVHARVTLWGDGAARRIGAQLKPDFLGTPQAPAGARPLHPRGHELADAPQTPAGAERLHADGPRRTGNRRSDAPEKPPGARGQRSEGGPRTQNLGTRPAYFAEGLMETPVLGRADVSDAEGPLIVEEYDATTLVPPGWGVRRDDADNLILERA